MSATDTAPAWARQTEHSNLVLLRMMRWVAMALGRRTARLFLHPITLYFLLAARGATNASRDYLTHVLGRPPRWRERYRHLHAFAATVLDRVYFLQGRLDEFEVDTSRAGPFDDALARGRGLLLVGAHFGSFEALRALGESRHMFPVAMVMYEDNAQRINATLRAVAPDAQLNTIALGRLDAMLTLRKWLDDGGVAGLLADRAAVSPSHRSQTHIIDFLGAPAAFSDGPFRLAALLRREVVFMLGLYHGGNRYSLRFLPVADFSARERGSAEAAIAAAVRRYAAVLEDLCREEPYNWFNFFDFWAPPAETAAPSVPRRQATATVADPSAGDPLEARSRGTDPLAARPPAVGPQVADPLVADSLAVESTAADSTAIDHPAS